MRYQMVTWSMTSRDPQKVLWIRTVGYPSDSLASCVLHHAAQSVCRSRFFRRSSKHQRSYKQLACFFLVGMNDHRVRSSHTVECLQSLRRVSRSAQLANMNGCRRTSLVRSAAAINPHHGIQNKCWRLQCHQDGRRPSCIESRGL